MSVRYPEMEPLSTEQLEQRRSDVVARLFRAKLDLIQEEAEGEPGTGVLTWANVLRDYIKLQTTSLELLDAELRRRGEA